MINKDFNKKSFLKSFLFLTPRKTIALIGVLLVISCLSINESIKTEKVFVVNNEGIVVNVQSKDK